jgi:hypothetical protein
MLTELKRLGVQRQGYEQQQQQQQQRNLMETALDTQKSCQSAVEILDDMILYDRITHGLVGLEKTLFNPWVHICNVVGPFRTQVFWHGKNNRGKESAGKRFNPIV